jgi:NAD(P) transhydrogenase subunit beta
MNPTVQQNVTDFVYLASIILFILSLKWLSSPATARRGVRAGEIGMGIAILATLAGAGIVQYTWILVGLAVGGAVGIPLGLVKTTAVPQRTALSHAFGALTAALIGISEFYIETPHITKFGMIEIALEVIIGGLTFTGSLIAAGKLQEILPQRPWTYRGQNLVSLTVLAAAIGIGITLMFQQEIGWLFPAMIVISLLFGVMLVMPIGGADMPTVIALLNSYAGLADALLGFVLNSKVLIVAGALDGASGFILAVIMCKAMNRSFTNVLFGAFGQLQAGGAKGVEERTVRSATPEDAADILKASSSVVIVPGYGMAVAQAQHKVRELYDILTKQGINVTFGVHPVAGRMPGHMNVLLAEADIPYDKLLDMDQVNGDMPQTDVALIIGANDVCNPAARTDSSSPIFGMPVIDVDKARTVMVVKRSLNPGFAGIDNPLFYMDKTLMLFGDAKNFIGEVVRELGPGSHM